MRNACRFGVLVVLSIFAITNPLHAQPVAPTLIAPANGATVIANVSTLFSWNSVTGATGYDLQFDSDTPINTGSATSFSLVSSAAVTHIWKVRARNAAGTGAYSTARSFTIVAAPTTAPTLIAPASGATVIANASTQFSWNSVASATGYDLQFDSETPIDRGSATSFSLVSSTLGVHTWRVRAKNASGVGPYSTARSFTVTQSTGNMSARLKNIDGTDAPTGSGTPRFKLYTSPLQERSGAPYPATFSNIPVGTYLLEGYQTGTFFGEEFWNSQQFTVTAGAPLNAVLIRKYPYIKSIVFKDNVGGGILLPGQIQLASNPVRVEVTVQNDVPGTPLNVSVRFIADISRSAPYDYDSSLSSTQTVAGDGGTKLFPFKFTPFAAGQFHYALEAKTIVNGTPLRTDSYDWTRTFIAEDDLDDQLSEATPLGDMSQTRVASGSFIYPGTDVKMYSFNVRADQMISFDIDKVVTGTTVDSVIRIFDAFGNELDSNDNRAGPGESLETQSYLEYRFSTAGTYYVGVSGHGNSSYNPLTGAGDANGSTGLYTLVVSPGWTGTIRREGDPTDYFLDIVRHDSQQKRIDPSLPTWIVIHGMRSSRNVGNIKNLADAITNARRFESEQILTLDWSAAASNPDYTDFDGENAIINVATWTANALRAHGFAGSQLNLVGHSWGAYVTDELAERMDGANSGIVNAIVVLDPAEDFQGGYDPEHGQINFAAHSHYSWAFHSSTAGSESTPTTANEAFIVNTGYNQCDPVTGVPNAHGAVVNLFSYMLEHPSGGVSSLFQLNRLLTYTPGPWITDRYSTIFDCESTVSKYEGIITTITDVQNPQPTAISYDLPIAPEITVLGNGISIGDGDTTPSSTDSTDFGSVAQGQADPTRTFTVRNDGVSTLTLGNVSVPAGFILDKGLPTSLSHGASDTFTVRLDTTSAGNKNGQISFSNNDSDENPFNFSITGMVTILPPAGTLQFAQASYPVNENAGTVTLSVTRTGGSSGAVSVQYATANGTALAPGDYTASSGALNWPSGDTAPKPIPVTIVNDSTAESSESFTVTLSNPIGGATLSSPATATVTIVDDDLPTPTAPTANPATNVTSSSFTANWGSSIGATGYRLDVSASSSFGSFVSGYQNLDAGNVLSRSVSGLSANTTYYYRVRAYNTGGTPSDNSNPITVMTTTTTANIQVTLQTNPLGRSYTVDGITYTSAQTFNWTSGDSHTIATTGTQSVTGTRYSWSNWSDGGAISHIISPTSDTTYTANFTTEYLLTINAIPSNGGTVEPSSVFYWSSGQSVSISATPNSGYTFSGWTGSGSGSYSGTNNPANVTMNAPISETATFSVTNNDTFNLIAGLNLISLPVQPGDPAIAKVLDSIKGKFSSVWAWNSASKKYEGYFPNQPIFLSDLLTMQAGRGYWLIMDAPATLTVSGATLGKTVSLEVGTNLVGFNSSTQKPIAEALSSITGKYSSVWAWNSTTKKYEGYFPNQPPFLSDLSVMQPGRGYFIIVTQKTDWIVP
jgi:pimeloyl-ACP methyl ester carboxylesterase